MAQISPEHSYRHELAASVIAYLQTHDTSIFPFATGFGPEQHAAFDRDLRAGLSDLVDSGSARKTSAVGNVMSDRRLREVVQEWRAAGGGWPAGADPDALDTALAALDEADADDDAEIAPALMADEIAHYRS